MTKREKMFRAAVHAAAEEEGKRIMEESRGVEVPESLQLRIDAMLAEYREKARAESEKKRRVSFNWRMAAAVAAVIVVLFVAPLATKAGRESYLKISQSVFPQYVQINIDDSSASSSVIPGISLSYVPLGYKLVIDDHGALHTSKYYEKDEEHWFDVSVTGGAGTMNIDNKDAVIKQMVINGYQATVIVSEEHVGIVWTQDDVLVYVRGSLGEETMLRIAEGIKLK